MLSSINCENFEHCYQITLGINHENKKGQKNSATYCLAEKWIKFRS